MSFFPSFSLPSFTSTDPVAAAQTKVDSAQAAVTKAKEEVTRLETELNTAKEQVTRLETELSTANTELSQAKSTPPANTADGVPAGGRRKRTYRKEKRPAKRRRNGRRSIRS
jgi:predicted  nucleic acid-binding Zn-ribbon protein